MVLRAGMNDHSNPFIRDEMTRLLTGDVGQVTSHGTFVHLFLNGVYKGIYNPTERISPKFLQAWHGGSENWDVIAQSGEIAEGDANAWNELKNFINSQHPANQGGVRRSGSEAGPGEFHRLPAGEYLRGHFGLAVEQLARGKRASAGSEIPVLHMGCGMEFRITTMIRPITRY